MMKLKLLMEMTIVAVMLLVMTWNADAAVTNEAQMAMKEGMRTQLFNPGNSYTYATNNSRICSCTAKGYVVARNRGRARITIRAGKKKSHILITVLGEPPTISLKKSHIKMGRGERCTLIYSLPPYSYEVTISYMVSGNAVTVSRKGIVTAKRRGSCLIRLKTSNGKTATCKVTVL